ncbi:spore coat protein [Haloimpatiens sp. FM7315]|uniref:spore coat protein n=1 Tax=Haloimpatiens sp. FM7315 TaxID=3298609 RepID=UPI0035A326EF
MNLNLSQKERMLLEDQKSHEQLCIDKYTNYSNQSKDPQLKQMFLNHANQERDHLNTINQMLSGEVQPVNKENAQGQQNQENQQNQQNNNNNPQGSNSTGLNNQNDTELCEDLLMTEKYVSGAYDTTIFEFKDTTARDVLNHIQKEEQEHGKSIYDYMAAHGMYKVQ